MLTELQKRKMTRFFVVWDFDGTGMIEPHNFDLLVGRLVELLGIEPASTAHRELQARYDGMWAGLKPAISDPKRTGLVLSEWLAACGVLLESPAFRAQVDSIVDFLWLTLDTDRDGHVSLDQYAKFAQAYLMPRRVAEDLFGRMGKPKHQPLSRAELKKLVEDFYWSDDPEAPGNYLWGPI